MRVCTTDGKNCMVIRLVPSVVNEHYVVCLIVLLYAFRRACVRTNSLACSDS